MNKCSEESCNCQIMAQQATDRRACLEVSDRQQIPFWSLCGDDISGWLGEIEPITLRSEFGLRGLRITNIEEEALENLREQMIDYSTWGTDPQGNLTPHQKSMLVAP